MTEKLTITINGFDDLAERAQRLAWHWAERDPWDEDEWNHRLRDVLSGLGVGRLRVAASAEEWRDLAVPSIPSPQDLDALFLVGLVTCAVSPSVWRDLGNRDTWVGYSVAAQALAARLRGRLAPATIETVRSAVAARSTLLLGLPLMRPRPVR